MLVTGAVLSSAIYVDLIDRIQSLEIGSFVEIFKVGLLQRRSSTDFFLYCAEPSPHSIV